VSPNPAAATFTMAAPVLLFCLSPPLNTPVFVTVWVTVFSFDGGAGNAPVSTGSAGFGFTAGGTVLLAKTSVRTVGVGGELCARTGNAGNGGIGEATGANLGAAAIGAAGNTSTGAGNGFLGNTNVGRLVIGANFGTKGRSGTFDNGASKVACCTNCRTAGDDVQTAQSTTITAQCNKVLTMNAGREGATGTELKFTSTSALSIPD
jgi:hypothetical protein